MPRPARVSPDGQVVPKKHDRRLQGAQIRIGTNCGRKVYVRAGGTAVLTPAGDIYAALDEGDRLRRMGRPADDMRLGLHNTARYYYYPGWHEPGTWRVHLQQEGVRGAPGRSAADPRPPLPSRSMASRTITRRTRALARLRTEFRGKVEVLQLPVPVLRDLRVGDRGRQGRIEKTPMAKKCTPPSRDFRRSWALGITSPKAPTINSSPGE